MKIKTIKHICDWAGNILVPLVIGGLIAQIWVPGYIGFKVAATALMLLVPCFAVYMALPAEVKK